MVFSVSFIIPLITLPLLIRKLSRMGFVAPDQNKEGKPMIAKFGGIAVFLGFVVGALLPLQLMSASVAIHLLLAALLSVALISFLAFVDDVIDIPDVYRVILPLIAALPLMLVKAGTTDFLIPFMGRLDLLLGTWILPLIGPITLNLYVLILIPIGVTAVSNLFNLLAGFNGLEAGTGLVVSITLLIAIVIHGLSSSSLVAFFLLLALSATLLSFLVFNMYPARIFPGNVTTYLMGAVVASAVILSGLEWVGAVALLPQIVEFFLKARSLFRAENFAQRVEDGRLVYEGPIYSLTHLVMKYLRPTERTLVAVLIGVQVLCGLMALGVFFLLYG